MLRLCLLSSIGLLGFLAFKLRPKHRPPTLHAPSITTITDIPSSSSSSSSSSPPPPPPPFRKLTYDVFLSFRGEDTRRNFTDHLYAALKRKGIRTFRDGEQLEKGKSIAPELLKAIEESRYAIVVLSRNYANSSWCLDEIANILDCMEKKKILPVFYDVDPSDFRKQIGDHFTKAFKKHEKAFKDKPDKVQRWKSALFQVASLCGWHLKDDGYESVVIQEIVEKISSELIQTVSISEDGLVGMDFYLKEMCSYLDIECPDVRVIGIYGMGGIGKTTIAEVVFEREKAQFEGYSFLKDVREVDQKQGVVHLQKQLLSGLLKIDEDVQNTRMGKSIIKDRLCSKRVLIVLDDVNKKYQLEALCDRKWFGPGSRIIITSRNKHLLREFKLYKVNPLSDDEALQLFRMNAFKDDNELVGEEILKLSKEFLKYANGLPLAIKVLGGSVNGRSVESWSSELDRIKNYPEEEIINVLKVSFDGLRQPEKEIFLDIACFFKGDDKDRVIEVLKGRYHDHCPSTDIEGLIEKSMITLLGNKLWMHDLMQTLGRDIVCKEYPEKPEKRSRLWFPKEIIDVLDGSKATNAIQSIFLQSPTQDDVVHTVNDGAVQSIFLQSPTQDDVVHSINNSAFQNISLKGPTKDDVVHSSDSFSKMDKLRLLKISNVKFSGNIRYISNKLQFLQWHDCPLDSFPSNFQPDNLVELHLHSSRIEQLWRGKQGWRMLRHIDMTGSEYLISTPDFTEVPFLEILVLEGCTNLVEVHPSLGFLKKLIYLNMKFCKSVESIPPFTGLEALETLNLSLCSRLKKFSEIEGNMESLLKLHLDGNSIEELSWFLVGMKNLKSLSCRGCKGAPRSLLLPASLSSLTSLIDLDLSDCNLMDGDIPDDLSSLISLRELDLSGNCFVRLPESFTQLSKLKTLYLRNCRQLKLVPKKLPLSLEYVHAQDCISLTDYPNQIKELTSVESGKTTVNSRVSFRTWSLYGGVNGVSNSAMSNPFVSIGAVNEIPEWFGYTSTRNPISIPIGDNKWKGVATCAVFSVNRTADVDFSSYWYQISLETDAVPPVRLKPYVYIDREVYDRLRPSSDLRWTCYEPRSSFPKSGLHEATVVRARFETNNPFVVVQKCGIRLVYEQDAGWFRTNKENFTFQIYTDLNQKISTSMEGYVGMDSHLNKMLSYLDIGGPSDVRIIGICGMGGIGKTTIAQAVSEMVRPQFEGYSFLQNVREVFGDAKQGAVHLQQKLLSDLLEINVNVHNTKMGEDIIKYRLCTKRVLIILDDVDQEEQLEALCHREWFGPGSRIIITSRNEHFLSAVDGDEVYKVNPLTDTDALLLFHMKAFKKDQLVEEEFLKLSKEFVIYSDGLPLAIKVLGSFLRGRRVILWSSTLDRLRKNPEKKIIDVLKVSFDGLEETENKTFLDIACFFKGWDMHRVTKILQVSDGHCLDIDIEVLMEKSLITLFGRNLWMHDLIQELGWEIVRQECREGPEKRSRLWVTKEIIHILFFLVKG